MLVEHRDSQHYGSPLRPAALARSGFDQPPESGGRPAIVARKELHLALARQIVGVLDAARLSGFLPAIQRASQQPGVAAGSQLFPRPELSARVRLVELGVGAAPALVVGSRGGVSQQPGGDGPYRGLVASELASRGAGLERSAELQLPTTQLVCAVSSPLGHDAFFASATTPAVLYKLSVGAKLLGLEDEPPPKEPEVSAETLEVQRMLEAVLSPRWSKRRHEPPAHAAPPRPPRAHLRTELRPASVVRRREELYDQVIRSTVQGRQHGVFGAGERRRCAPPA